MKHFSFKKEHAGEGFAMLRGEDGFSLVIMTMNADLPNPYPSAKAFGMDINFHLGFIVSTPAEVYAKHKELEDGGCQPGQIKTFDAIGERWTAFYCPVGDGIDVEVTANEEISK